MYENNKKAARGPGRAFKPGVSGNPGGRPKLTEEQKEFRESALSKAVEIMHNKVHDAAYIESLRPQELHGFLELVFDRCGLPRVTKAEVEEKTSLADDLIAAEKRLEGHQQRP